MPEASFLYYLRSCSWALGILSKTVTEKALLELQTKRKWCSTWNTHIKIWRPSSEQKAFQVTPLLETKTWYYCHLMTYCSIRIALKYIKTRRGCRAKKKKKKTALEHYFSSVFSDVSPDHFPSSVDAVAKKVLCFRCPSNQYALKLIKTEKDQFRCWQNQTRSDISYEPVFKSTTLHLTNHKQYLLYSTILGDLNAERLIRATATELQ